MRIDTWSRFSARLLPLLLALPWSPLAAQEGTLVQGRVLRQNSGIPLEGAVVTFAETGVTARTTVTGRFEFRNVPAGTYQLSVVALGQAPYHTSVTVAPGQPTYVNVAMEPTPVALSGVVVTASKTETEIRDVPAAVNVLTNTQIQQSGASTFTEAMRAVPGVSMEEFGENFNSLQMRGVPRFSNENEATLIMLDGVPQTDARNSAQLLTLPIDNIDHVEVVKGPNSALYGRTAVDGVVNIITQDPTPEQHFWARLQTGQWDFVRAALTASGPITAGSKAGYLLSWMGDQHQSFNTTNAYHKHASSLFGKFTTPIDEATQFTLEVNYALNRGGTPAGDPLVNGRFLSAIDPSFSPYANLNLPSAEYNEEHVRTMNRIRHEFAPNLNLTNVFGYRHDLWNFINDGDFFSGPNPGADTVTLFPFTRPREEDAWFDDLRWEARLGPDAFANHVLVGGSLERNTGYIATQFPFTDPNSGGVLINYHDPVYPGPADFLYFDKGSRTYQGTLYSGYVQDEIAIERRLRLNLGLRYDNDDISADTHTPGKPNTAISGSGNQVSPKIGASYRLLDSDRPGAAQLSVYVQYSRAFRPAEYAGRAESWRSTRKNPLAPEHITNYEAGIKGTTLNNVLAFEASVFDMLRDGIEIIESAGPGLSFQQSPTGRERFKGIETGVTVQPMPTLLLHANYAYYDGRYEQFTFQVDTQLVSLNGLRVQLSPHHMVDIGGAYDRGAGLGVALSGEYEGNKALDFQNTVFLPDYFVANGRRELSVAELYGRCGGHEHLQSTVLPRWRGVGAALRVPCRAPSSHCRVGGRVLGRVTHWSTLPQQPDGVRSGRTMRCPGRPPMSGLPVGVDCGAHRYPMPHTDPPRPT